MAQSDSNEEVDVVTFDNLRKKKKPHYKEVAILLDPNLGDAVDEIRAEILAIEKGMIIHATRSNKTLSEAELKKIDKDLKEANKRLEEAENLMYEASIVFKFKSIGRRAMDDLLTSNLPTKAQIADARTEGNTDLQYNPDTFPQALISASCVSPAMGLEEVQELWDDEGWTTTELLTLFTAAQEANQDFRSLDPKKGSGRTRS